MTAAQDCHNERMESREKGRKTMRDRMSLFGINMARRGNRRWLVAVTYLGLMVLWAVVRTHGGDSGEQSAFTAVLLATSLFVNGVLFGGYGRWGLINPFNTRTPLGSPTPWHNDERDLRGRDRAHYHAYRVVVAVMLLGYVLGRVPFQHPEMGRALIEGGVVLGLTLPQALLLWMEPDVEFEEPEVTA
jgi:hypothetical protein